jgi:hypothetical protein
VNAELKALTNREMPPQLIEKAWPRLTFTSAIRPDAFATFVEEAQSVGFLKGKIDIGRLLAPQQ